VVLLKTWSRVSGSPVRAKDLNLGCNRHVFKSRREQIACWLVKQLLPTSDQLGLATISRSSAGLVRIPGENSLCGKHPDSLCLDSLLPGQMIDRALVVPMLPRSLNGRYAPRGRNARAWNKQPLRHLLNRSTILPAQRLESRHQLFEAPHVPLRFDRRPLQADDDRPTLSKCILIKKDLVLWYSDGQNIFQCATRRCSGGGTTQSAGRGPECHRQDRTNSRQKKISDQSSCAKTNRSPNDATNGFTHARLFCVLSWHCLFDNGVRCVW